MGFEAEVIGDLTLTIIVLLWAKWSMLDLGLRVPAMAQVWPWILLFGAWIVLERTVAGLVGESAVVADSVWLKGLIQRSTAENVLLILVTGPISEELLFRGALFSALIRRWGLKIAVFVPSVLWALLHTQFNLWFMASIAGSGVLLGIIRYRSGSLYVPIGLHVAANAFDMVLW